MSYSELLGVAQAAMAHVNAGLREPVGQLQVHLPKEARGKCVYTLKVQNGDQKPMEDLCLSKLVPFYGNLAYGHHMGIIWAILNWAILRVCWN